MHLKSLEEILAEDYTDTRLLPDGRWLGVHRLLYHWTMHVDISEMGYESRYCYRTREAAAAAMMKWDGTGDPEGWDRSPETGRRRPDGDPAQEYVGW